jgi:hypothetical protein
MTLGASIPPFPANTGGLAACCKVSQPAAKMIAAITAVIAKVFKKSLLSLLLNKGISFRSCL